VNGFQSYFLWGPGDGPGDVVMPDRMRVPITLCRGLKVPMLDLRLAPVHVT
jgi:hypothetical protein